MLLVVTVRTAGFNPVTLLRLCWCGRDRSWIRLLGTLDTTKHNSSSLNSLLFHDFVLLIVSMCLFWRACPDLRRHLQCLNFPLEPLSQIWQSVHPVTATLNNALVKAVFSECISKVNRQFSEQGVNM